MFFNYLIKDFFKNLKFLEHGKTRKFHVYINIKKHRIYQEDKQYQKQNYQ